MGHQRRNFPHLPEIDWERLVPLLLGLGGFATLMLLLARSSATHRRQNAMLNEAADENLGQRAAFWDERRRWQTHVAQLGQRQQATQAALVEARQVSEDATREASTWRDALDRERAKAAGLSQQMTTLQQERDRERERAEAMERQQSNVMHQLLEAQRDLRVEEAAAASDRTAALESYLDDEEDDEWGDD